MTKLIAVDKLVKEARGKGVDFGKGDPYNRLRYYTKMGWVPHMIRKKDARGNIVGHFPLWTVSRLVQINKRKESGLSNEEISERIKIDNIGRGFSTNVLSAFGSPERRFRSVIYLSFVILLLILGFELGVFGKSKRDLLVSSLTTQKVPNQIVSTGSSNFSSGEKIVFVKNSSISADSKVYVTFNDNYSPASKYWVSNKVPYVGFYVELDTPIAQEVEFSWWVSN